MNPSYSTIDNVAKLFVKNSIFLLAILFPTVSATFFTFVNFFTSTTSNTQRLSMALFEKQPMKTALMPHEAEGIIFDIDGTLANSWKLGYDATQIVLKKFNLPNIDEALYHECTKYSTPERLARHAGLDPDADGGEFWKVGKTLADKFDSLYVGLVNLETAGFYEGIKDLILNLSNAPGRNTKVRFAALTNACAAYAHAVLKTNCPMTYGGDDQEEIYSKFLSIHGADTVPKPKPYPDGLIKCCKEIRVDPQKCLYIGDSPSDGFAAKAAGCVSIGVLWGSHSLESLKQAPFDHICLTVDELRTLLIKE